MPKEKIKLEIIEYLLKIETKVILTNFEDNKILLLENLKKLKLDFFDFFKDFETETYSEEYFLLNVRRICRFFKKKLVVDLILFLDNLKNRKQFSKKEIATFHIKFLIFV